jgi:hypothetical protein
VLETNGRIRGAELENDLPALFIEEGELPDLGRPAEDCSDTEGMDGL